MSTLPISTGTNGEQAVGTTGDSVSNNSATNLSSNEFLDLMVTELQNQDPLSPSSSDPTQFLSQLAQLTSVEQETDTAQNTQESATEQAVSQSVSLIGQTVTYVNQQSGADTTGTVNSVQITSSGPTLTIDGTTGIDPADVITVAPTDSSGSTSGAAVAPSAQTPATQTSGTQMPGTATPSTAMSGTQTSETQTPGGSATSGSGQSGSSGDSDDNPFVF
jgi:flagellar basal-body rod modification protein FlgD